MPADRSCILPRSLVGNRARHASVWFESTTCAPRAPLCHSRQNAWVRIYLHLRPAHWQDRTCPPEQSITLSPHSWPRSRDHAAPCLLTSLPDAVSPHAADGQRSRLQTTTIPPLPHTEGELRGLMPHPPVRRRPTALPSPGRPRPHSIRYGRCGLRNEGRRGTRGSRPPRPSVPTGAVLTAADDPPSLRAITRAVREALAVAASR